MDYFEQIKKYSGLLIIPFTWLAYYIDFGVSQVLPSLSGISWLLSDNVLLGVATIITMLLVAILLIVVFQAFCYIASYFRAGIVFVIVATIFICFGVAGLFKGMEIVPFQHINLFWHLSSLSIGVWLLESTEQQEQLID